MHAEYAPSVHRLVPSDRVEGTQVRTVHGRKLGVIHRVMINKVDGMVAYAVVAFGGLLGIGKNYVPVPWDRLQYDPNQGAYRLNLAGEEMKKPALSADHFDWIDIHNFYDRPILG